MPSSGLSVEATDLIEVKHNGGGASSWAFRDLATGHVNTGELYDRPILVNSSIAGQVGSEQSFVLTATVASPPGEDEGSAGGGTITVTRSP
jgi:hypothetical protein